MLGLKDWEPDDEKRYIHIIENMIYVSEIQPKNMFLYMFTLDTFDKYNLNIYTGSYLEEGFDYHMKNVWDIEKFDIVIGNPPFNQMIDMLFVQKSYNISNIVWLNFRNIDHILYNVNISFFIIRFPIFKTEHQSIYNHNWIWTCSICRIQPF